MIKKGDVEWGEGVEKLVERSRRGENEERKKEEDNKIDGKIGLKKKIGKIENKDGFGKIRIVKENGEDKKL